MASKRKTPQTWIEAGLKALPRHGPDALRAETLSRLLETTKGSFYWHFKDVPAFQLAVLDAWEAGFVARFDAAIAGQTRAVARLRALAGFRPTALDRAVRGWAAQDKVAAGSVARVDAAMEARIAELLSALDATHPDFPGLIRAAICEAPNQGSHTETLIDLLLVLK